MPQNRLFLERRSYRRRRVMDALRLLPFLCALLWVIVPAMWPNGPEAGRDTASSSALWYLFSIWVLAITASFVLWRKLRKGEDAGDTETREPAR